MRTLVVVPTHDEAANIGDLLDGLDQHVPDVDVLVIDDASVDDTRAIVRARSSFGTRLRLIERGEKRGLGDAYVHAFGVALADGYDAVVQIDADLSHDPTVLPTMLDLARRGIDVVIGSRYIPGGSVVGWPRRRTWLSRWGNRYAAIALGLAINDATAGYRVYRAATLRRMDLDAIRAEGYGFQIEMTYRAVAAGCSIVEVPIAFRDRVAGDSKMSGNIVREAFLLVTWWAISDAVTLRRRRRAYHDHD
ncbi:MAG: polyprenol monophosphomannose synthase [Ilumatobacter sp.]|uniref:polyprenol monophosphomannose synthase n=1 Tax=Ilumatobacter sp. TaxID=1967498 RepID=UPI003C7818C7